MEFKSWIKEDIKVIEESNWKFPALLGASVLGGLALRPGNTKPEAIPEKPAITQSISSIQPKISVSPGELKIGTGSGSAENKPAPEEDSPKTQWLYPKPKPTHKIKPSYTEEPFNPETDGPSDPETEGYTDGETLAIKRKPVVSDDGDFWTTTSCHLLANDDPEAKLNAYKAARVYALKHLLNSQGIVKGHITKETTVKSYRKGKYLFIVIKVPKNGIKESIEPKSFSSFVKDRRKNLD